jgi:electron transfer flavoprotein beta subunit
LDKREITLHRRAEGGVQVLRTQLPCLITMLEGTNEMRFATMPNMFRAARFPLKLWNKDDAGIEDVSKIGLKGSPTIVSKVFAPQAKSVRAEIIDCESKQPKDLAVTLLTKMFTKYPNLAEEVGKANA